MELPHEFAWSIVSREVLRAGLLPVPEEVDLAIVLKAAATAVSDPATPEYLKRAVQMPGLGPAALRTLRDIAAADVTSAALEAFAPQAPDGEKVRMLARIADGYHRTLASAQLIDREALYLRAAATLPADGAAVILIDAAFAARTGVLFETVEGESQSGTSLSRVQDRLFVEATHGTPTALDDSVRFLSAPGESLEAVEIARLILEETARGVRFQEIAVLMREPSAYAAHLASAFDRAGISAFFLEGVPRIDQQPARSA